MLGSQTLVAFVATADLDRARDFYEGTLGLTLAERTSFACVFDAGGTSLRSTLVERVDPAPYTVLGWTVADLAATIAALEDRGVELLRYHGLDQDERGVWRAPSGARVAWFRDPDGNVLSVTQPDRQPPASAKWKVNMRAGSIRQYRGPESRNSVPHCSP